MAIILIKINITQVNITCACSKTKRYIGKISQKTIQQQTLGPALCNDNYIQAVCDAGRRRV